MNNLRHTFALLLIGIIFASCDDKITNPGDFSIQSELQIVSVTDTMGNIYPVQIARAIDTTYVYSRSVKDTLKDANGTLIYDSQNKLTINTIMVPFTSMKTAKYYEISPIVLVSSANELRIRIASNARWQAPTPNFGTKIPWVFTQINNGGGDASIKVKINKGLATKRRSPLGVQYVFTRDSLTLCKLVFDQKALNE